MNYVVIPVCRMTHSGHPQHLVVFGIALPCQVPVGDYVFCRERKADVVRLYEFHKAVFVFIVDIAVAVYPELLKEREVDPLRLLPRIIMVGAVAYRVVRVQVDVIYAAVV